MVASGRWRDVHPNACFDQDLVLQILLGWRLCDCVFVWGDELVYRGIFWTITLTSLSVLDQMISGIHGSLGSLGSRRFCIFQEFPFLFCCSLGSPFEEFDGEPRSSIQTPRAPLPTERTHKASATMISGLEGGSPQVLSRTSRSYASLLSSFWEDHESVGAESVRTFRLSSFRRWA